VRRPTPPHRASELPLAAVGVSTDILSASEVCLSIVSRHSEFATAYRRRPSARHLPFTGSLLKDRSWKPCQTLATYGFWVQGFPLSTGGVTLWCTFAPYHTLLPSHDEIRNAFRHLVSQSVTQQTFRLVAVALRISFGNDLWFFLR
jgi:hypothetical protein